MKKVYLFFISTILLLLIIPVMVAQEDSIIIKDKVDKTFSFRGIEYKISDVIVDEAGQEISLKIENLNLNVFERYSLSSDAFQVSGFNTDAEPMGIDIELLSIEKGVKWWIFTFVKGQAELKISELQNRLDETLYLVYDGNAPEAWRDGNIMEPLYSWLRQEHLVAGFKENSEVTKDMLGVRLTVFVYNLTSQVIYGENVAPKDLDFISTIQNKLRTQANYVCYEKNSTEILSDDLRESIGDVSICEFIGHEETTITSETVMDKDSCREMRGKREIPGRYIECDERRYQLIDRETIQVDCPEGTDTAFLSGIAYFEDEIYSTLSLDNPNFINAIHYVCVDAETEVWKDPLELTASCCTAR